MFPVPRSLHRNGSDGDLRKCSPVPSPEVLVRVSCYEPQPPRRVQWHCRRHCGGL